MTANFNWKEFSTIDEEAIPEDQATFNWDQFTPAKETSWKSALRYAYQPISGALTRFTYPLNLLQTMGTGEALSELDELEERLPELKKKFPHLHWPEQIDKEQYRKSLQIASDYFPTQQNIERIIEEQTNAPLTAQNKTQNRLRLSGSAGSFKPGNLSAKATAAVSAPVIAESLEKIGTPESIADTGALILSQGVPTLNIATKTKPSGLAVRQFESIKKPTRISSHNRAKIHEVVENDFKKIAKDLVQESSRSARTMQKDPAFKNKIKDLFLDVENLSKEIQGTVPAQNLRDTFIKKVNGREKRGITPDAFERFYLQETKKLHKEIPLSGNLTAEQMVQQYRKNNRSLKDLFEPGQSRASNRAKAEAIFDYNKAIEDIIHTKYPDSAFSNIFTFSNKRWSEIKDIEFIEGFFKDLFNGKIKYSKGKDFFTKNRVTEPFRRTLGRENYKRFETLMEDLMSTEQAMSLIRKARSFGFKDIGSLALKYVLHPSLAKTSVVAKSFKAMFHALSDKPQLSVTWESAVKNFKKGNYSKAQEQFRILSQFVKNTKTTEQEDE